MEVFPFFMWENARIFLLLLDPLNIFPTSKEVNLDAYFDANVHFGYRISDRLSVFVKGSNLLADIYEKWYNFPVQGIQGLAGVTYKFDW